MKPIFGILLILLGIAGALYLGLYLMFIGGIIEVIEQVRAPHLDAAATAWGIVRILGAGAVSVLSVWAGVLPGFYLIFRR